MNETSFAIHTLGCKINQVESQLLRQQLLAQGLAEAAPDQVARLVIVNSCALTAKAVAETRALARKAARHGASRVIIAGCAATAAARELSAHATPGEIVPRRAHQALDDAPCPETAWPGLTGFPRARAVLKVQDGCNAACAFCIVPRARGGPVSRPLPEIVAEAVALAAQGIPELVVSGINLGQYQGQGGEDFWDMLAAVNAALAARPDRRPALRLSSLDPALLTDKGLRTLANASLVRPHLHLSLQSGDARTLSRMGRRCYTPESVLAFVENLSGVWPRFALGADILTGFPGETDEEFSATLGHLARLPLTYAHVFPFSARPQTLAAKMPGQVPHPVAAARAAKLRAFAAARKRRFAAALARLPRLEVAVEQNEPAKGVCEYYLECEFLDDPGAPPPAPGRLARAVPVAAKGAVLYVRSLP